jgi:site-specific DNA recombinase
MAVRVACYARVSTEDQAERQTIGAQTDFLRRYCELHDLTVAGVYVDDGISGTLKLEDRPEGRRLLDDAKAGAFSVVLVYKLDRLGRSLKALLGAHDQLEAAGVAVRSGTEPFDTSSPVGRFVFSLLASVAELDRATTLERMSRGRDRVAGYGQYTGGPIPFGYDLDPEKRLVPSARSVEPLEMTEAEVVRDLFRRIADGGATLNGECKRLNGLGVQRVQRYGPNRKKNTEARVLTRSGRWETSSLALLIHNPIYKGAGRVESRFGEVERPSAALVDVATWERAQRMTIRNRNLSKRGTDREYLLRGLVRCGLCGVTYVGRPIDGVRKYSCNNNSGRATRHATRCTAALVDARRLEATIWGEVKAFVADPSSYIEAAQAQHRAWMADAGRIEAEQRALAAQLAGKDQERERVLDLFRRGRITASECDRDLDKVAAEAREIREQLDGLRARLEMGAAQEAYLADVGALMATSAARIREIEENDDRAAMREHIELLVPSIVVMTELVGHRANGQRLTRTSLKLRLAFGREGEAVSTTPSLARRRGRRRAAAPPRTGGRSGGNRSAGRPR